LVPAPVSTVVAVIVTFIIAWLSYRIIEKPGISLGRTLEKLALNDHRRATAERS
jgi:peptidoglycan/LPS O-acetylase OafA/YrhL